MSEQFNYEKAVETAEARRDYLREENATCNNCCRFYGASVCASTPKDVHCDLHSVRPLLNVCYDWRPEVEQKKT